MITCCASCGKSVEQHTRVYAAGTGRHVYVCPDALYEERYTPPGCCNPSPCGRYTCDRPTGHVGHHRSGHGVSWGPTVCGDPHPRLLTAPPLPPITCTLPQGHAGAHVHEDFRAGCTTSWAREDPKTGRVSFSYDPIHTERESGSMCGNHHPTDPTRRCIRRQGHEGPHCSSYWTD